ncbi:MAG: NAD(P)H-dependent oxidoreductase [Pirellulales bacterium]|nr:NAD(P)H-dependent oxidoreductase [Pirellulales bacterium]
MTHDALSTRAFRWMLALLLLPCGLATAAAQDRTTPPKASEPPTVRVLITYYSRTGNTEQLARGVARGVGRVPHAVATVQRVEEVTKESLQSADAIALGCPTYFGNIPGKMKIVIDDWNWKWKVNFTDKVGGAFTTGAGQVGGKEFTVISLLMFMINNRMVVAGPLYQDAEGEDIWAEAGAAAMTGPLDPGISAAELDAAARLGERLAKLAAKMRSE